MKTVLLSLLMAAQSVTWTPIASWTGDGTKETEAFTVTAKEWRITWKAEKPTFGAIVWDADKKSIVTSVSGSSSESYVHQSGRFYISVTAINNRWTVSAEQPKQ